jgi:predicted ABC-type ATPase
VKGEMNKKEKRRIIIIAGPNGAGKTTFAEEFLPNEAGLRNFEEIYKPIVDEWALYDNSSRMPILVEEGGIQ